MAPGVELGGVSTGVSGYKPVETKLSDTGLAGQPLKLTVDRTAEVAEAVFRNNPVPVEPRSVDDILSGKNSYKYLATTPIIGSVAGRAWPSQSTSIISASAGKANELSWLKECSEAPKAVASTVKPAFQQAANRSTFLQHQVPESAWSRFSQNMDAFLRKDLLEGPKRAIQPMVDSVKKHSKEIGATVSAGIVGAKTLGGMSVGAAFSAAPVVTTGAVALTGAAGVGVGYVARKGLDSVTDGKYSESLESAGAWLFDRAYNNIPLLRTYLGEK